MKDRTKQEKPPSNGGCNCNGNNGRVSGFFERFASKVVYATGDMKESHSVEECHRKN